MLNSKHAMIVALTALVIAVLGSTPLSQAAARFVLPKNSVGASQLKKGAVTGLKVKDGTLVAADFKAGTLPAGGQGAKGETGAPGAKGDLGRPARKEIRVPPVAGAARRAIRGAQESPGVSGWEKVRQGPDCVNPGLINGSTAQCPPGKKVLGRLASTPPAAFNYFTPTGWIGAAKHGLGCPWQDVDNQNAELQAFVPVRERS